MDSSLKVGQSETYTIVQKDAAGNVITPSVPFDAPPVFSEDTPATASLTPDAILPQAVVKALAAGTDTVQVTCAIGGVKFSATSLVTVAVPPPVVASIELVAGPAS